MTLLVGFCAGVLTICLGLLIVILCITSTPSGQ